MQAIAARRYSYLQGLVEFETLAAVREQYWVVKGRVIVKKVIRRCIVCRRYDGRPFPSPPEPDLPAERVSEAPPFSTTGIDFLNTERLVGVNDFTNSVTSLKSN